MRAPLRAALLLTACLAAACTSPSGSSAAPRSTASRSAAAAELAAAACGHRADRGGPPAPTPIGVRWQPTVSAYDATRHFAHTNAGLAGQAAGRDPSWAPLGAAWRDLADIYETAREEYAAVLANRASAAERANLAQLQDAAATALATITQACRSAP